MTDSLAVRKSKGVRNNKSSFVPCASILAMNQSHAPRVGATAPKPKGEPTQHSDITGHRAFGAATKQPIYTQSSISAQATEIWNACRTGIVGRLWQTPSNPQPGHKSAIHTETA